MGHEKDITDLRRRPKTPQPPLLRALPGIGIPNLLRREELGRRFGAAADAMRPPARRAENFFAAQLLAGQGLATRLARNFPRAANNVCKDVILCVYRCCNKPRQGREENSQGRKPSLLHTSHARLRAFPPKAVLGPAFMPGPRNKSETILFDARLRAFSIVAALAKGLG